MRPGRHHLARERLRPRVVHVTTTDVSLVLLLGPQLRAFAEAGYEVIGASAPGPWVAQLEAEGTRHWPLRHATRSQAPHRDLAALAELRSLFLTLTPDIVHTHNPKPGVYGRLAARAAGVGGIINTVHGLYATPGDTLARRAAVYSLERVAATCSDIELVQNVEDIDVLVRLGVPRSRLRLLGNGIDLDRFSPEGVDQAAVADLRRQAGAADGDVLVGAVGRLVWEKGYRELFEAAGRLRFTHPTARLVVVGPADPAKVDGLGPAEMDAARAQGVVFLGERTDMASVYAALDIYVLASHREGFPRSAMEAAAMGLPVVATDIRGCRQVVEPGRTGLLVPPRSPADLASALGRLVEDPGLRAQFGQAGRSKALTEFDQRKVIEVTLEAYRAALAHPPAPPATGSQTGEQVAGQMGKQAPAGIGAQGLHQEAR
ncbi:MAG: glycosyltransferase family 4 protein [Acidimicrobiales bacterium]